MSRPRLFALAALAVLATPGVAHAADEKNNAAFLIGCVTVVPLALVPLGLAFHLLLRAVSPRRMRQIVHVTETRRQRTAIVGFVNLVVLALLVIGTGERAAPVAHAVIVTAAVIAFVGLHGVARALGARALGSPAAETLGAARSELRELAVGWFVIAYVSCFPVLGWVVGAWWLVRALGAVVCAIAERDPINA